MARYSWCYICELHEIPSMSGKPVCDRCGTVWTSWDYYKEVATIKGGGIRPKPIERAVMPVRTPVVEDYVSSGQMEKDITELVEDAVTKAVALERLKVIDKLEYEATRLLADQGLTRGVVMLMDLIRDTLAEERKTYGEVCGEDV